MSYLSSDREVAYQRAGTAIGREGKGGWEGPIEPGLDLELETGAGCRSWGGVSWALGGLVAGDPLDKRAKEAHWHRFLNLSCLVAV